MIKIMQKLVLTTILTLISVIGLNAQVAGLKIINQRSSIPLNSEKESKVNLVEENESVYKTQDIIEYNYLTKEKTQKKDTINDIINKYYDNSDPKSNSELLDSKKRKSDFKKVDSLRIELKNISIKQDSLYSSYLKDLLNYNNWNWKFGSKKSKALFDIIYDGNGENFKTLGNSGFNFGSKSASIYSELVSGSIYCFRVSLGTMITSSSNDSLQQGKKEEAYQRLVSYGGNTVLNIEYPLMFAHTTDNYLNLISRLIVKGTSDLPAFGTSTDKWAGSGSIGIDIYGDASLSNNKLRFFFNLNENKIFGTDVYRNNLGIANNNFTFGQLTLGLVFSNVFKISFIVATFSSEASLRNKSIIAGGQVLR